MIAQMSWEESVKTTTRMLTYIQGLPPHDVGGAQCLYNTRRLIGILSKVLLEIVKCSKENVEILKDKKNEIECRQSEIQNSPEDFVPTDLRDTLYTEIRKVEVKKLTRSHTVCTSPQCSEVVGNERIFKQICCDDCKGFISTWTCKAFKGISGATCRYCGCKRAKHEWRATTTELTSEVLFDNTEEGIYKVLNRDDALRKLKDHCEKIEEKIAQMECERKQMLEAGAMMSIFLEQKALVSTASTSDNLGSCLRNERDTYGHAVSNGVRQKMSKIEYGKEREKSVAAINKYIMGVTLCMENLNKLIDDYDKYYESARNSGKVYTMQDVHEMIDDLYKLPMDGKTLKVAVSEVKRCEKLAIEDDHSANSFLIGKISKVWQAIKSKKQAVVSHLTDLIR